MTGINLKELKRNAPKNAHAPKPSMDLKALLEKDITLFSSRFPDKQKESFYLEMATLLTAGLDIKSALELIEQEQAKPKHAAIIRQLKEDLINGDALWQAMEKSTHFTPYEYYSIQIGEETGRIAQVLDQLYHFFSAKLKQRRQFVSALSYPIIILCTSVGAVAFMLLFIVPMFSDIFKRFGGELPYLTRVIIRGADAVQANFLWITALIILLSVVLYTQRQQDWLRKLSARLVRYVPVIGRIMYAIQLARFCTSMGLLLGAKVPMIRSIHLVQQMITFYPIQITLTPISDDVMGGTSLHQSMARFSVYNRKMVSLIKVGEEVNRLDVFFEKLASQYSTEVEHQTGLLNTFLEPAMIIFLGGVVGFILLAMYLPMFQLSTSIGG